MSEKIAAIVVTYNRKDLLLKCLDALRNQTRLPDAIFIIDNLSTDGTQELLHEKGYISRVTLSVLSENQLIQQCINSIKNPKANIQINYILKFENDGGAGGFYEGTKQAFEADFDWIWLMDDDGCPDENALKFLVEGNYNEKEVRCSLCLSASNRSDLSFKYNKNGKIFNNLNDIKKEFPRKIDDWGSPFNSILITKRLIPIISCK